MTQRVLIGRVNKLKALETQIRVLGRQAEELKQDIKADMEQKGLEEQAAGEHIIRFKAMVSNRFDSKAFKSAHSRLYGQYMKRTTTKRFSIA